jgi:FkbM family methyltransferase
MSAKLFHSLRLKGYSPRTLLDIGANNGDFTHQFLSEFKNCVPTLIEPNPHCLNRLKLLPYEVIAAAASDKHGTAEIFLTREWLDSTGASLYRENTAYFRDEVLIKETVETVCLDNLLEDRTFDFVKIDVQGGELDVLNGGTEVIRKADYILIEVPIVEYNVGAPPAERVFEKLKGMGFRCTEAVEFHRLGSILNGNLLQIDFLFERVTPRASQSYRFVKPSEHEPELLQFLAEQKRESPDFTVVDIGGVPNPVIAQMANATFGSNARRQAPLHFDGNLNEYSTWEPLLDHVARYGKFSYSLCSHILEDVALPTLALEMLPRIAEAGHICVTSKYLELLRHEGPYRGYIHHRWIFCPQKEELVLVPKISLLDHMPFDEEEVWQSQPERWELNIYWRKGLQFSVLNNDYLGPNPQEVVKMYATILAGLDA